jgi:hypothetical protein
VSTRALSGPTPSQRDKLASLFGEASDARPQKNTRQNIRHAPPFCGCGSRSRQARIGLQVPRQLGPYLGKYTTLDRNTGHPARNCATFTGSQSSRPYESTKGDAVYDQSAYCVSRCARPSCAANSNGLAIELCHKLKRPGVPFRRYETTRRHHGPRCRARTFSVAVSHASFISNPSAKRSSGSAANAVRNQFARTVGNGTKSACSLN